MACLVYFDPDNIAFDHYLTFARTFAHVLLHRKGRVIKDRVELLLIIDFHKN